MENLLHEKFGVNKDLIELSKKVENELQNQFKAIDNMCELNSLKVLEAFQYYNISEAHFNLSTGYGYGDLGRDTIEKVYSRILKTEDSLVRIQFVSGTHAISTALFSILRPGDTVLSINGKPYDTLDEIIGLKDNASSLKSMNVNYEQVDLKDNRLDYEAIQERVKKGNIKLVIMQRSRGYSFRPSICIDEIEKAIKIIKNIDKNIIVMVDNCYGEFVEDKEPTEVGADLIVGSLIKNLGGGLAHGGAYIAGRADLIDLAAQRLTAPGLGKEAGASLGVNRQFLQGLFLAPNTVANSVKGAIFASKIMEELGYEVSPRYNEKRTDIIQAIKINDEEKLIKFCQGIQKGSPVDSSAIPTPWEMPGYEDKIIMACGSFIEGASIELSCDAPIRAPYIAYLQGGLTYSYAKIGILKAVQEIMGRE